MTDAPKKVKLIDLDGDRSDKTNGFWDSDHAGVFQLADFPALDAARVAGRPGAPDGGALFGLRLQSLIICHTAT